MHLHLTYISVLCHDIHGPTCFGLSKRSSGKFKHKGLEIHVKKVCIKYTIYVVTVKHNYLLCLQLKVHTWRPVSIKQDDYQAIFINMA